MIGKWKEGFVTPIEWDLTSTHLPIFVGVNSEEKMPKHKNQKQLARFRRNTNTQEKL